MLNKTEYLMVGDRYLNPIFFEKNYLTKAEQRKRKENVERTLL